MKFGFVASKSAGISNALHDENLQRRFSQNFFCSCENISLEAFHINLNNGRREFSEFLIHGGQRNLNLFFATIALTDVILRAESGCESHCSLFGPERNCMDDGTT